MRKNTVRLLLKVGSLVNLALIAAVAWDYFQNGSAWMWPLLATYGAFLLAMLVLFFARPQGRPEGPKDPHPMDENAVRLTIAQRP